MRFKNKTVIVTGAGSGIGETTAIKFAQEGANVIIADIDPINGKIVTTKINDTNGSALFVETDVSNFDSINEMVNKTINEFDPPDILINNAGTSQRGPFLDITDKTWKDDLDLKLFAAIRFSRLLIPKMKKCKWGRIINVLNVGAKTPLAEGAPTAVSRAAGMALMKVLANEGAPHNVLVNALLVGKIKSDQWERRYNNDPRGLTLEEWYTEAGKEQPLGRLGSPEEFASLACFLVSDKASYINGGAINIDGGLCASV